MAITPVAATLPAMAQAPSDDLLPDPQMMNRVQASVDRALQYLAEQQQPDGTWPQGVNGRGPNNGVNGVCLLAFLGRGHVPGRGPYKEVLARGIRYILSTQDKNGVYVSLGGSHGDDSMYEQALATLSMIESYGFMPSVEMRRSVQRAVDLIVRSQNDTGGWRYQPTSRDADLSVTVMQIVALRSAINARLNVPDKTMDRALAFVHKCANQSQGGFSYQPGAGASLPMSAAGALSLQLMGHFDDPAVPAALKFLKDHTDKYNEHLTEHFYYMNYYAMQAYFQAGGEQWAYWAPRARDFMLEHQNENGSWPGYGEQRFNGNKASCYSTAMACIALEVYMHYLPAYQR